MLTTPLKNGTTEVTQGQAVCSQQEPILAAFSNFGSKFKNRKPSIDEELSLVCLYKISSRSVKKWKSLSTFSKASQQEQQQEEEEEEEQEQEQEQEQEK